jgi:hypothetical protein
MVTEESSTVKLRLSGGRVIETFADVLHYYPDCLFAECHSEKTSEIECGHRDGKLVRLIVEALRRAAAKEGDAFYPPEDFDEWRQLIAEARYWRLDQLAQKIKEASSVANTITIAYHGSLSSGRSGLAGKSLGGSSFNRTFR